MQIKPKADRGPTTRTAITKSSRSRRLAMRWARSEIGVAPERANAPVWLADLARWGWCRRVCSVLAMRVRASRATFSPRSGHACCHPEQVLGVGSVADSAGDHTPATVAG